jgi:hypothetical protein
MMSISNNPWIECFSNGELIFETRFLIYSLGYCLLAYIGNTCQKSYVKSHVDAVKRNEPKNNNSPIDHRSLKALIASRPTVIAATVHSVITSIISCGILCIYYLQGTQSWTYNGINLLAIWQTVGLPISISYFLTDCYFYCLPRKDALIFVHHIIMVLCHYPVVHNSGAILGGAGNIEWVIWLSIIGYTSEVSTAVMNYRWYLINTLEENWIGFGITNAFVAASWGMRVVMFTYLLVYQIFPRKVDYVAQNQLLSYYVIVFGHAAIGLLSLHWCIVMLRPGLKNLFVFKKKKVKPIEEVMAHGFSFADEVSGRNNDRNPNSSSKKMQ